MWQYFLTQTKHFDLECNNIQKKSIHQKKPFFDHLPTQVCLQKTVFLTYSWVITDKMDTILPIASSTWTFSALNMDKIGLIVLQKRNQQKTIPQRAYSRKNIYLIFSYKTLPQIIPSNNTRNSNNPPISNNFM